MKEKSTSKKRADTQHEKDQRAAEIQRRITQSRCNHQPGLVHHHSDGAAYRVGPTGAWERMSERRFESRWQRTDVVRLHRKTRVSK
jgi:hypothetical protein